MRIGKIVSSSSHIDYVCQVYGPGEVPAVPAPEDYGFGVFVGIEREGGGQLVGVIYDTTLLNPEFGNLGPRLSSEDELAIFSPDYVAEKVTVVGIVVVGSQGSDGRVEQGVPVVAARVDDSVRVLGQDETIAFHRPQLTLRLAYLPMLISRLNPLAQQLALGILQRLSALIPEEAQRLKVLEANLAWRTRVEPVG